MVLYRKISVNQDFNFQLFGTELQLYNFLFYYWYFEVNFGTPMFALAFIITSSLGMMAGLVNFLAVMVLKFGFEVKLI